MRAAKKAIDLDWQNNNFAGASRLFYTFLYNRRLRLRRTTATWNCLLSRFLENVNTRRRLSFSFPELWLWRPSVLNFRKICQHFTNWTTYNKHDKAWSSAYSLFNWRFRNRRRPCYLSSLTVSSDVSLQGDIHFPELVTAVSQSFLLPTYTMDTSLTICK